MVISSSGPTGYIIVVCQEWLGINACEPYKCHSFEYVQLAWSWLLISFTNQHFFPMGKLGKTCICLFVQIFAFDSFFFFELFSMKVMKMKIIIDNICDCMGNTFENVQINNQFVMNGLKTVWNVMNSGKLHGSCSIDTTFPLTSLYMYQIFQIFPGGWT